MSFFDNFKRLFVVKEEEEEADPQTLPLAAAALLFEVAWADHELLDEELIKIKLMLIELFDLEEAEIDAIIAESKEHHEASVGVYKYTRLINESWSIEERQQLLFYLWRLAFADDDIHRYEEHVIRRIGELLYLKQSDFIQAKQKARRLHETGA